MNKLLCSFPARSLTAATTVLQLAAVLSPAIFSVGTMLLLSDRAAAQSATTGAVSGTVTDPSGAIIPKAQVDLVSADTNAVLSQSTNTAGQYVFSGVRPGAYRIKVTAPGFRPTTLPGIQVEVNKSADYEVKLEVGGDTQIVEVTTAAGAQLQTADAQIGNSITQDLISRLPALQRNVTELMFLQPGVVPTGGNLQLRTTGAIEDQNTVTLDGVDVTAVVTASTTSVPTPQDSVEEFRVNVSNPNANLTRASGGQMTLVGRHGSNVMHGSGYSYFQNSVLNANTWDNNLAKVAKPDISDKRYGGRFGGALKKDRTFLFGNYEGRDFDAVSQVQRTVPTDTLKQGILRFRDVAGNVINYDLKTSKQCGPTGDQPCDPRGLGISPSSKAQLALMPASNLGSGGDGLNTLSYLANIGTPIQDRYLVTRLDHIFSEKLTFNGSYTYFRRIQVGSGDISIQGGSPASVISTPQRGTLLTGALTQQLKANLINVSRFGFVRDVAPNQATAPSMAATLLNIPGTNTSAGNIALLLGGGVTSFLDSPIDMDTQRARYQASFSRSYQFSDDLTWIKSNHTLSFGFQFMPIWYRHDRADKVVGSLTSLVATVDQGSFLTIPSSNAPPVCTASLSSNCIKASDTTNWGKYYAAALGLVDNIGVMAVRDASLKATPLGTNLVNRTWNYATYFNAQDTWRINKSWTVTYGFSYGWQTAPKEDQGQQTVQLDLTTGKPVDPVAYMQNKLNAAKAGQVYNPTMGWVPVDQAKIPVFNVNYGNFSPRAAFAYSPDGKGFLGSLFGEKKTAIRGGFAMIYDRSNLVQNVLIPMLGVGFGQNISVNLPGCGASGAPGPGCVAGNSNPALSSYRVGVDGVIPLPVLPPASVPVTPSNFSETLSFQVDPNTKTGKSYNVDLSIQRELPGGWFMDVAYVGRFARNLPQAVNLTQSPYMFTDPASGQTFAQAYDSVRASLRGGTAVAAIPNQPFFENQLKGVGPSATQYVVSRNSSSFSNGNVSNIFLNMGLYRRSLGMQPFNNDQSQMLFMRTYVGATNYNGLLVTVAKRLSHGLQVNANYTWSKSLDDDLQWQNNASFYPNSFYTGAEYGPSIFDRKHVFNLNWVYDLPAGKGHRFSAGPLNRVIGGWYLSGIATMWSGVPLIVLDSQGSQSWGDAPILGSASGAIPTGSVSTGKNPPASGTGFNLFSNGTAAITGFRPMLLSADTQSGRSMPFRGLPYKNIDFSVGKNTDITERLRARFSADFFNAFNHPNFANPSQSNLSLSNPNTFGLINQTYTPPNRTNSARWIQFMIRLEF